MNESSFRYAALAHEITIEIFPPASLSTTTLVRSGALPASPVGICERNGGRTRRADTEHQNSSEQRREEGDLHGAT